MNPVKLAFGVLAGVAVGAAIGTLYAPDKGSSTRKRISQKSEDFVGKLESKFNGVLDTINGKLDTITGKLGSVKRNVDRITETGKNYLDDGIAKAEEMTSRARM